MKILVATQTKGGLEDLVSPVFGRAPTFTIVEVKDNKIKKAEVHQNTAASGFRGVGIQAAQFAANKGVDVIIAGNIGPYASSILAQTGIEVVTGFVGMKVKDAVESYLKGTGFARAYPARFPVLPATPQAAPLAKASLTHKECINFQNGFCTLYGIPVDPNGTDICPNFMPRGKVQRIQPKLSKLDIEFEKRMLELEKKMIEEQINYLDKKIKELEKLKK